MENIKIKLLIVTTLIVMLEITNSNAQIVVAAGGSSGRLPVFTGASTVTSSQIQDNGTNVGVGTTPSGTNKLEVNGNINIPGSGGYYLGGSNFLFNNSDPSSVFLGAGVGYTGSFNIFIGTAAGVSNPGRGNSYVGYNTGNGGTTTTLPAYNNAAIGENALHSTEAYGGCAVGYNAAGSNSTGCGITAVGEQALNSSTTGDYNSAIGHRAGQTIVTGMYNSFLGDKADGGTTGVSYSTAIGQSAIVQNDHEMILGDNSVYVGIGYSGVLAYPPGKLSVDENVPATDAATIAGFFRNEDVTSTDASIEKRGVEGICDGYGAKSDGGNANIGGDFIAQEASYLNIGIRGPQEFSD